ncbi:MAG: spore germination protein GerW family protein [Bacillota bacterium]|nr:spore germination protein GerW family protein [Bacillota bacterium]
MVDVNTIVGDIIESDNGVAVVPISRVSCGFVAGGGECASKSEQPPFVGGSGAGLAVAPVGFIVICGEQVRLIPVAGATPFDRAIEAIPQLTEQLQALLQKCKK